MNDLEIIALYWARDQQAIVVSAEKYGAYCRAVAYNILGDPDDTEECLNDTWLRAWNAMPPHRPQKLSAFLAKLCRNLSFDRWRRRQAEKRGGGETILVLDELAECICGREDTADETERREVLQAVKDFLRTLPEGRRGIFLRRYWYAEPVGEIARRYGMTANEVSVTLNRLRKKLRTYLEGRGLA